MTLQKAEVLKSQLLLKALLKLKMLKTLPRAKVLKTLQKVEVTKNLLKGKMRMRTEPHRQHLLPQQERPLESSTLDRPLV